MSTDTADRPLKPGEKRVYAARVKDLGPAPRKFGGDWNRVRTLSNPAGQFSMRATAEDALERATSNDHDLAGHVFTEILPAATLTLETVKIDELLTGNVVPISAVPVKYRAQYEDTLRRAALAAARAEVVLHVNESFRTREQQQHFWDLYLAGGNLAARPGTGPHEFGIGLDIPNVRLMPDVIAEMRKLDLRDDVPSEKWHLTNHHRVA